MYVGRGNDEFVSGELSTDDCEDSEACLRIGVRGARDSDAKGDSGDISCKQMSRSQRDAGWRARAW